MPLTQSWDRASHPCTPSPSHPVSAMMSDSKACPNCGSNEVHQGRVIGKLDLGGGLGFRPDRAGWLRVLFRPDVPLRRRWSGCANCGIIWSFGDAGRIARAVGSSDKTVDASLSADQECRQRGTPIWNQGSFVPRPVRRRRMARRLIIRCTIAIVLIVGPFAAYAVSIHRGVPSWLLVLCGSAICLLLLLWVGSLSQIVVCAGGSD